MHLAWRVSLVYSIKIIIGVTESGKAEIAII